MPTMSADPIVDPAPGLRERMARAHDIPGRLAELGRMTRDNPEQLIRIGRIESMLDGRLAVARELARSEPNSDQRELVRKLKSMMARFEETRDLRLMGGYRAGTDPDLDQAITLVPRIYEAMRQEPGQAPSRDAFLELAQSLRG